MTNSNPIFESKATHVTFYEDRAEVTRTAALPVAQGLAWMKLRGASLFLDDRSVQARPLSSGFSIIGVRVSRQQVDAPVLGHEARQEAERENEALHRQQAQQQLTQERLQQRRQHLEGLLAQWAKTLQSNVKIGQSSEDTTKESFELLQAELFTLLQEEHAVQRAISATEEQHRHLVERLRQASIQKPRYESVIEVQIQADTPQEEATLELRYFTPAALWRPEHMARLRVDAADERRGTMQLTTFASTWQRTGEDWSAITASFSTARPAREATPPMLQTEVLELRRKTEEEKQHIIVEAREQSIQLTAESTGSQRPPASEMPGVDDGGEPLLYRASEKVSLVSDGQPFRVEIAQLALPCEVSRVLFPEKAPVAYLRAKAMLNASGPLLAGPVQLAREAGFVGKSKLDFIGPGDFFTLGFGVDDAIRVRRRVTDVRDTTPLTGTQKLKRAVTLWVSNLSDETKNIDLVERIPVSEIEDLEISLLESDGARHDPKDGFLKRPLTLTSLAFYEFSIVYEVRAPAKMRMPF